MKNVLFLTHERLLRAEITGGVQLCSQEFLRVIENCAGLTVSKFYVNFTRRIQDRVRIRLGWENYSMYDVDKVKDSLLKTMEEQNIEVLFINMSSAMRFAKPVRDRFGKKVKIVLLSHGNHSGDFLHLISRPIGSPGKLKQWIRKFRLGMLVSTESEFRVKYIDAVVAISETERQIENWINAPQTLFFPRMLTKAFLTHHPSLNRIGFVGRLDHPPNLQGLTLLCDEFAQLNMKGVKLRLVGAPLDKGQQIARRYPFIEYLGELTDKALEEEAATWSFFLNPVWWYSTGATTKLGKGISWGIPIATSTAGMRGYKWREGNLLVADTPAKMATKVLEAVGSLESIHYWATQTKLAACSGPALDELSTQLEQICN